jgi:DNA repair photolyase
LAKLKIPFSNFAKENTHRILEKYLPTGTGVVLITKRKIPKKTVELISQFPDSVVPNITLSRLDQEMNAVIEKNASSTKERLETIKNLTDAGIKVTVRMTPVFPQIDDDYDVLDRFMRTIAEAGAYQVKVAYVVIRDALAFRPIIKKMTRHPRLKEAWKVMTEEIKIYKGKGNVPPMERRVKLYEDTSVLAQKYGLKSGACTVLDYPLLQMKEDEMKFTMCKNILANLDESMKSTFVER